LQEAKSEVYLQSYIVEPDQLGLAVLGKLAQLARQGVKVHLMFDGRGSITLSRLGGAYLKVLLDAGVKVVEFNPVALFKLSTNLGANHEKLLIVDGRYSVLGGRNVAEVDLGTKPGSNADMDVAVDSDALAKQATLAFIAERDLHLNRVTAPRPSTKNLEQARAELERARMQYETLPQTTAYTVKTLFSGTHPSDSEVLSTRSRFNGKANSFRQKLFEMIRAAKSEIILQNAYVVLTEEAVAELRTAAQRGVKIILHTNSIATRSSTGLPEINFEYHWRFLIEAIPGIQIYSSREVGQHLHSKAFVFDGDTAIVGSYNLDRLSDRFNSESAVLVRSRDIAARIRHRIMRETETNSVRHLPEGKLEQTPEGAVPARSCFYLRGMWTRFLGNLAYFLRPIL
jgi:phosphatidylserine/phosphatidylglycerophosphate/cardiolipin synthase-like enzyme